MKRILLPIIVLVLLASLYFFLEYSSKPNYEQIAITKVKEVLLDPNSFELIKVEKDTIWKSNMMEIEIINSKLIVESWEKMYLNESRKATDYLLADMMDDYWFAETFTKQYKDSFLAKTKRLNELKEREALLGTENDYMLEFVYVVRGYAITRGGIRMIGDWEVRFDTGYGFLGVSDANSSY